MEKTEELLFLEKLCQGANELAIELSETAKAKLLVHFRTLKKWAKRMNLTTVLEPIAMAEKLYLDSARVLFCLQEKARVHDVGTGAGFPGLVLKALCPSLSVTLTEARRKKISFLKQVARDMEMSEGLEIRWARLGWEEPKAQEEAAGGWDEVISRATFPLQEWVQVGSSLLAPGGRLWLYVQTPEEDEGSSTDVTWEKHIPPFLEKEDQIEYTLPFSQKKRWLIPLRRIR